MPQSGLASKALLILFVFSVASGVFFFGSLKLLTFHWITISVLVSLLLVGMPIGGFLAIRFFDTTPASIAKGFLLQVAAMLVTLVVFPLFLDPTTQIDELLNGQLGSYNAFVLTKFGELACVFLPYFIFFGLNEFLAYRVALPAVRSRSEIAYAVFLGGTSVSYVVIELTSQWFGVVPLMLVAAAAVAEFAGILQPRPGGRIALGLGALLVILAAWPGMENRYIRLLEGEGFLEIGSYDDAVVLHREWGRYCHFSVVQTNPDVIVGYYNGGLHWLHRRALGFDVIRRATFWDVPYSAMGDDGKVLVIGAGGGEQVRLALTHDPEKVVAVEIIPEVLEVLGGKLSAEASGVYRDPRVTPVAMDGRQYLERTDERFDVIYLPTVDTHVSMMRTLFNSAETLYTVESFAQMRDHLTEDGFVVIRRPAMFDVQGRLIRSYFHGMKSVGLQPVLWTNSAALVPPQDLELEELGQEKVYLLFGYPPDAQARLPEQAEGQLQKLGFKRFVELEAEDYRPKTDDFLFRSDILMSSLHPADREIQRVVFFALFIACLVVVGLRRMFRRRGSPGPIPFWGLVVLGILVGINFLLLEQFVIYKLYRILARPMDAMFFGTVGFLCITGGASLFLTSRARAFLVMLAIAIAASVILALRFVTPESISGLVVALPLIALTGALFPTIFRGEDGVLLTVFAADAIGAAVAGVAAFLWPVSFGFMSYDQLTLCVFVLTVVAVALARWRWRPVT